MISDSSTKPHETAPLGDDRDAPFNRAYIFAIALTAAMGGLMFGYDWVVIGGAELFYEKYFHLVSALEIGWAMSSALIGALAGAMFAGAASDKLGRKPLLVASGLLFVVTSIGTSVAPNFPFFVVNLVPALAGVRLGPFIAATALGVIPAAVVFALAGTGLDSVIMAQKEAYDQCAASGRLDCRMVFDTSDVFTPQLIVALIALGLLVLVLVVLRHWRARSRAVM